MAAHRYLAFDLGAESGRAFVGRLDGQCLTVEELYRFSNGPEKLQGTLYWNILSIYHHVLKGMRAYVARCGPEADGIGIDTWGVDFGLLARDGSLLQNPVAYRDRRTEGMLAELEKRISPQACFQRSGSIPLTIHTAVQLLAMRKVRHPVLEAAATLLMLPDLLAYFLTGVQRCERSMAFTTLLYDMGRGTWSDEVLGRLDLPRSLLPELIDPGTPLGDLYADVRQATGLNSGKLIAPCTHDTPSAVAATPGQGDDWAFVSCGTWSVVGALTSGIITTPAAFQAGFCNGLTLERSYLCENIIGLWVLQQTQAAWQNEGMAYTYEELAGLASQCAADGPLIDMNDPRFLAPQKMGETIRAYCRDTGQRVPAAPGEVARCILESLALSYRRTIERLGQVLARSFRVIHIVGGGSRNQLLCRFTADATGLPVLAGPAEATVIGNLLVQAHGCGVLAGAEDVREVVRRSWTPVVYEPARDASWDRRYEAYCRLSARVI